LLTPGEVNNPRSWPMMYHRCVGVFNSVVSVPLESERVVKSWNTRVVTASASVWPRRKRAMVRASLGWWGESARFTLVLDRRLVVCSSERQAH